MENNICEIDKLNISDKWKRRFHLLKKFGADELSHGMILKSDIYRKSSFRERLPLSMMSNFPAFFGGYFYYFYKRMHLKGFVILSFSLLWTTTLSSIEFFSGVVIPDVVFWTLSAALCSQWANYDLYRKTFHNEVLWDWIPVRWRNKSSVMWFLALSTTISLGSTYYAITHTYSTNAAYDDPKAVSVSCGSFVIYVTQEELNNYGREVICYQ